MELEKGGEALPIFEYESKKNIENIKGTPVVIQIESLQRELEDANFFGSPTAPAQVGETDYLQEDEAFLDTQMPGDFSNEEGTGMYTLVSRGELSRQGELLQLTYQEELGAEDGADTLAPTQVCLTFSDAVCSPVTVSRSGDMRTVFTVEQGARQYSTYHTPYGQIDMCVIGKKVENRIGLSGGVLVLDYAVELRGMITQRTKMTIRVKPERG